MFHIHAHVNYVHKSVLLLSIGLFRNAIFCFGSFRKKDKAEPKHFEFRFVSVRTEKEKNHIHPCVHNNVHVHSQYSLHTSLLIFRFLS